MEDIKLVLDLVMVLGVALLAGMVAQRLNQPVLLGYIVAGVIVGPNTPGLVADRGRVELLANVGVAFLMFGLGVEFSFAELQRVRRAALVAGGIQIPATLLLGTLAGLAVGWAVPASILLGCAFAISSSIVALKLLLGRGEADSPQGRYALGLGIVQDLSVVPMLALLPLLAGGQDNLAFALARSIGVAAAALVAVVILGTRLVPRVLYAVARTESRELFLLAVVSIALGTAVASHAAGLSLALGAFLAGLVVSESGFDSHVLAEIIPLRDLFATLFFVAVGMLIDPDLVLQQPLLVLGLIAALIVGKTLITGGAFLAAGLDHRTATLSALFMAQIGEFSFVLAGVGLSNAIISRGQYGLILSVALGSILAVPLLMAAAPGLVTVAERLPGVAAQEARKAPLLAPDRVLSGHVVICGYGRVGSVLGEELERRGVAFAVIDINPAIVRTLQDQGIAAYYGDAGADVLLEHAGIAHARTIAITVDDPVATRAAIIGARRLNPRIGVVARAITMAQIVPLEEVGADDVVQPELVAGLSFVEAVLRRQDVGVAGEADGRGAVGMKIETG